METVQVQLRDVNKVYKPTNIVFGAPPCNSVTIMALNSFDHGMKQLLQLR